MYTSLGFISMRRLISIFENASLNSKCSYSIFLNGSKLICPNSSFNNVQNFNTLVSTGLSINYDRVHQYLKERKWTPEVESQIDVTPSVLYKLENLSKNLHVKFDNISYELNYRDPHSDFINSSRSQLHESYFGDGNINLYWTHNELFLNYIKESTSKRMEEEFLNRNLEPSTFLFNEKVFSEPKKHKDWDNIQHFLDTNIENVVDKINPNQAFSLLKSIYLLKLNVSYKNLSEILKVGCKGLNELKLNELVEYAICLRAFVDNDNSYFKYYLLAVGSKIEEKLSNVESESQERVIECLLPLALMQMEEHPILWSAISNCDVLNAITKNHENLPVKHKANLLIILSSLGQWPEISNKYYRVYEELMESLKESMKTLESKVIINMMMMPIIFPNLQSFREVILNDIFERWKDYPLNALARIYLKIREDLPFEASQNIVKGLSKNLKFVLPKYVPDLYCAYLKEGEINRKVCRLFENEMRLNTNHLTMKNISNILMYLSINGKEKTSVFGLLFSRFNYLKKQKSVSNQEVLDVVLSMSLVGVHNQYVWKGVNLSNLVHQTPRNVLVYLGYAFLITSQNDKNLWKVLVERILNENKNPNSETYEVLKAAQILEYVPAEVVNHRFKMLLYQCRHHHFSKLQRQRYRSRVPYEELFDKLGIKFMKNVKVNDIYEAPYLLPDYSKIIEPSKELTRHPTSGSTVGEVMLRHRVLQRMGYNCYSFADSAWEEYYEEDEQGNGSWNLEKMGEVFNRKMKLSRKPSKKYSLNNYLGKELKVLNTKSLKKGRLVVTRTIDPSVHKSKIKRLQVILGQRSGST